MAVAQLIRFIPAQAQRNSMYREGEDGNAGNYFAKFRVAKKKDR